ncbi:MAG: type IV secretion system protein TraC [Alphaproteobacteria bacterium]|nr:type IV secretion system protein TraC [Alphaproteobacteria bacterium]MBP9776764.1 type IV secretion system protein TraC [Alphaproteobacteria bacterium]
MSQSSSEPCPPIKPGAGSRATDPWNRTLDTALGRDEHCYGSRSSTLKLANEFLFPHSLSELLPYRSFDPETQLFLNRVSVGFVLETLPLVGCGEEIPRQLTGLFQHALPLGSNLQCLLIASPHIDPWLKTWEKARCDLVLSDRSDVLKELAKERCSDLRSRSAIRTFRLLISYSEPHTTFKSFEEMLALREQLVTTLKGWGLPVKVWQAEDLLLGLDELLNPTERLLGTHESLWNPHESLSPQLMNPATRLKIEPSQLIFGEDEKVLRLYTTRLLPPLWHLGAMGNLIGDPFEEFLRLQGGFFLAYGVHICNEKTLKTKMLAKCGNVEKQAVSPIAKYVPSLRKEAEEWTYVREKFEEGQRLVRTRFQVGLLSHPDHMSREEQTLFNLYRSQRWELVLDKYLQLPGFLSCLPMTWGEGAVEDSRTFQKTKTTLSHEPSNLMPLQGEWQGTKSPGMMLVGRRGQLFYWSPFDNNEGNYNTCVVGRSGSGKSVFMQELMTSILGMGGRVFVLDVGRSFEKTVKLLKGTFVEFSTHSPICINPFSSIPSNDSEAASDGLAMLKPILSLMAAPKEGTTDLEDTYLEQALQDAWHKKQNKATITDVANFLLKHHDLVATTLGERLYPYTEKGSYGRFFNGQANIDLSDSLVVVEMEELKERKDLQSVIVQMVILQIANSIYMGDRKTPSCLILDEAWDMLRGAQSGVFIETAARRLRKYFGGLVVGTQSINDFYATPGAQAAFDNADWMCLLSQKDESIELLKNSKRLSMDPAMERTLRSLHTEQGKYAEIMIKGPKGFAVGRLFLDDFSKVLYSTKADEFTAVQSLVEQGFSLKEAIQMIAKVPL